MKTKVIFSILTVCFAFVIAGAVIVGALGNYGFQAQKTMQTVDSTGVTVTGNKYRNISYTDTAGLTTEECFGSNDMYASAQETALYNQQYMRSVYTDGSGVGGFYREIFPYMPKYEPLAWDYGSYISVSFFVSPSSYYSIYAPTQRDYNVGIAIEGEFYFDGILRSGFLLFWLPEVFKIDVVGDIDDYEDNFSMVRIPPALRSKMLSGKRYKIVAIVDNGYYSFSRSTYFGKIDYEVIFNTTPYALNWVYSIFVEEGQTTGTLPTPPSPYWHDFKGWYIDTTYKVLYNPAAAVTERLNLYALYKPIIYSLIFDSGLGINIDNRDITALTELGAQTAPDVEGYNFVNWYTDSARTIVYDPATVIKGDITLYALYDPIIFKVIFMIEEEEYLALDVRYGSVFKG